MGILRRFEVTFDYPHHVMWLSKGPGFEAPDRYDRSGLWLGLTGSIGLRVVAVAPGSPAEQAGIRVEDVVSRLGTIEATGTHLFAIRRLLEDPHVRVLPVSGIRGTASYKTVVTMKNQIQPQ
jgi:C-terminal processing protease CtpA/Prc